MQGFTVFFLLPLIFIVHAEVVQNFKGKCDQYFYNGFVPQLVGSRKKYVRICQRFANKPYFATLYDTANRIPVYSAYIFERNDGKYSSNNRWRIEPQLVNKNWETDMMTEGALRKKHHNQRNVFMGESQAIDSDYGVNGYDRGHLNPNQHHIGLGCKATYTLTNAVPQDSGLNRGFWRVYEKRLRMETFKDCTTAYVLVGAIPSQNNWVVKEEEKNRKRKRVNRVNIPDYLWHAYCCVDNNNQPIKSGAAAVRNVKTKVVECSLDSLKGFFQKLNLRDVELFENCKPETSPSGDCASVVPQISVKNKGTWKGQLLYYSSVRFKKTKKTS